MAKIVICDDEPHVTRAVELKLRKAGHHVRVGHNGAEGLQTARDDVPDLIITDCQMPVMSGIELCREASTDESLRRVPIIMLTAKALELSEQDLRSSFGVRRLMYKPFSPREIVTVVEGTLADCGSSVESATTSPFPGTLAM